MLCALWSQPMTCQALALARGGHCPDALVLLWLPRLQTSFPKRWKCLLHSSGAGRGYSPTALTFQLKTAHRSIIAVLSAGPAAPATIRCTSMAMPRG